MPTRATSQMTGVLSYASEVARLRSPEAVVELLDRYVAREQGLHVYACWRAPLDPGISIESIDAYRAGDNVWVHRSVPAKYWDEFWPLVRKHGPSVIARLARTNPGLFTWTEASRILRPSGEERWVWEVMRKHGLRDGVHCPVGPWIVGFWSTKVLHLPPTPRAILTTAAHFTAHHLEALLPGRRKRKGHDSSRALTARELAVLRNYSLGNEVREIAKAMKIGEGTVKTFLTRMQRKLKAKHRGHAVLLAMRDHLIT